MTKTSVYKIFLIDEWEAFAKSGRFAGNADDERDGYIHLAFGYQVPGSLERHFPDDKDLVLAAFDQESLGSGIKLERSHDLFPHLYGTLPKESLTAWARITRTPRGDFDLPEWCRGKA